MSRNLIDLRKQYGGMLTKAEVVTENLNLPDSIPSETAEETLPEQPDTIQWEAYEYIKRNRSTGWYFTISAVALAFVILGILADNYLFVAFLFITAGLLGFYWKREPRRVSFALTPNHLLIGNKPIEYSRLKSFCFLDGGAEKELILETDNMLNRYLNIPVGDELVNDIKIFLGGLLPEKEYQRSIFDALARYLGL